MRTRAAGARPRGLDARPLLSEGSVSRRSPRRVIGTAQLLSTRNAAAYVGLSQSRFYEVRKLDARFPKPVRLPGDHSEPLYRKADLQAWLRELPPVEELPTRGDRR